MHTPMPDRRLRSPGAAAVVVTVLLVLGGCASGPATISRGTGSAAPTSGAPSADVSAQDGLRAKFRFYAQDDCASGVPEQVYGRCGRFVAEIRNTIPQMTRDAPDASRQADAASAALDRFASAGCQADPGATGGGDPAVCGPAFHDVQASVRAMAAAVGAA